MIWFFQNGTQGETVFVAECGFNVWTSRTQRRLRKGSRIVRMVSGSRGKDLTVCVAVSPRQVLLHFLFVEGGMTKELFILFIWEVSALLADENMFIINGNAPPHRDCPLPHAECHDERLFLGTVRFWIWLRGQFSASKVSWSYDLPRLLHRQLPMTTLSRLLSSTLQRHRMNLLKHHIEERTKSVTPANLSFTLKVVLADEIFLIEEIFETFLCSL